MEQIQIISISPQELASLIAQEVGKKIDMLNRFNSANQIDEPKEIMTRKETADLFSISTVTVHDWVNTGIIKPYKVGNRTYFKRSELMEAMK